MQPKKYLKINLFHEFRLMPFFTYNYEFNMNEIFFIKMLPMLPWKWYRKSSTVHSHIILAVIVKCGSKTVCFFNKTVHSGHV